LPPAACELKGGASSFFLLTPEPPVVESEVVLKANTFSQTVVLGLALLIGAGALMSHARQNDPPKNSPAGLSGCNIATVDMNRVYMMSGAPRELDLRAAEYGAGAAQQLQKIQAVPFLEVKELQEFGTLLNKSLPSEGDTARMEALRKLSDQRAVELQGLQAKPQNTLTPAEKTRLDTLTTQSRFLDKVLPGIQQDLLANQQARVAAYRQEQIARLRGIVAQEAKAQGFAHVFDANALVYSVNDLTTPVLKRIDKQTKK
jgi:Skp family chaperone for outer membrane proteins